MSDIPFTYDEHVATFRRLVADINTSLTREDRERLVAFTALEADADVFGIPGLEKLPAIISVRTSSLPRNVVRSLVKPVGRGISHLETPLDFYPGM